MSPESGDQPRRARRRSSFPVGFDLDESKLLVPGRGRASSRDPLSSMRCRGPIRSRSSPWWRHPATARRPCSRSSPSLKSSRVAWVSVDDRDNDPAVLFTYLAVALDRVGARRAERPPLGRDAGSRRSRCRSARRCHLPDVRARRTRDRSCRVVDQLRVSRHGGRAGAPTSRGLAAGDRVTSAGARTRPAPSLSARHRRSRTRRSLDGRR